ncbi:2Fe-2S iron-sulfur cluster-binding protein [Shewanella sp. UCD-KL12]|uniref:2Fe-2S iron-sulfur cluster-binding protein n=1 Tax=Shewanella sp. UCD-KL12 TaxID=1917163 RepID=UPI0009712353|nr:2Fe-2S iron-sulfur cluster-binding protein [Shewanella sp. UCD-KL12]
MLTIKKNTNLIEHPNIGKVTDFQCRDGYCGFCKTKLISGEVTYNVEPLVLLRDDEVLPCVGRSLTTVVLETR